VKKRELRAVFNAQLRAKKDAEKPTIEGYAAVYNVETEIYSYGGYSFRETIAPGAFTRTLKEKADVRCLFNHDEDRVLGRTKSGTLTLTEDKKGLFYTCELPDTQEARDLHALISRGDIDECSFGFYVIEQEWKEKKDGDTVVETRTLLDLDLFDVSPVTFPAYPQTSVSARSKDLWPDGMPAEIRSKIDKRAAECQCECDECEDGDCMDCSDPDCADPNCDGSRCMEKAGRSKPPLTKSVEGEALTPAQFAYVGDPTDTRTWKLAMSVKAIRNSIARFNELKAVPAEAKPAAWEKLVAAARAQNVTVSDEDRQKWNLTDEQFRAFAIETPAEDPEADKDAAENERVRLRARCLEASAK
jgi:HK97 family phage prohead protease